MKIFWCLRWAALVSVVWLTSSCSTVSPQLDAGEFRPQFSEGATADLVLRFFTWDSIYMTRPDTRADGFLPLYVRDDIGREVKRRNIGRNMAVVIVSLFYREPAQVAQLSREWTAYLSEQGFRRVVIRHAGPGQDIDTLPLLYDSAIGDAKAAGNNDEQPKVTSTNAAVPPSAGAGVANPPGPAIR